MQTNWLTEGAQLLANAANHGQSTGAWEDADGLCMGIIQRDRDGLEVL